MVNQIALILQAHQQKAGVAFWKKLELYFFDTYGGEEKD